MVLLFCSYTDGSVVLFPYWWFCCLVPVLVVLLSCAYIGGIVICSKLTGMAFRVPVPDVSVVDLTCRLNKGVSMGFGYFYFFVQKACILLECLQFNSLHLVWLKKQFFSFKLIAYILLNKF